MSDIDLKNLADYHTEIWHERNGWVATKRSVTPSVQLFKIGYVLGMEKLKQENARLREALEFYADGSSWQSYNLDDHIPMRNDREDIYSVCGMRARKALEKSE